MMIKKCWLKYKRINLDTGYNHVGVDGNKDDYVERACNTGKGPWCKLCQHYRQAQVSNAKWMQIFDRIKKENKAPQFFKRASDASLVGNVASVSVSDFKKPLNNSQRKIRVVRR